MDKQNVKKANKTAEIDASCRAVTKVTQAMGDQTGVTKHRNGTERNGIYRNEPEYTGTRRNDSGMKGNGQEWNRNVPERRQNQTKWTRIVPECSGTSWNDTAMKRNDTSVTPE